MSVSQFLLLSSVSLWQMADWSPFGDACQSSVIDRAADLVLSPGALSALIEVTMSCLCCSRSFHCDGWSYPAPRPRKPDPSVPAAQRCLQLVVMAMVGRAWTSCCAEVIPSGVCGSCLAQQALMAVDLPRLIFLEPKQCVELERKNVLAFLLLSIRCRYYVKAPLLKSDAHGSVSWCTWNEKLNARGCLSLLETRSSSPSLCFHGGSNNCFQMDTSYTVCIIKVNSCEFDHSFP